MAKRRFRYRRSTYENKVIHEWEPKEVEALETKVLTTLDLYYPQLEIDPRKLINPLIRWRNTYIDSDISWEVAWNRLYEENKNEFQHARGTISHSKCLPSTF